MPDAAPAPAPAVVSTPAAPQAGVSTPAPKQEPGKINRTVTKVTIGNRVAPTVAASVATAQPAAAPDPQTAVSSSASSDAVNPGTAADSAAAPVAPAVKEEEARYRQIARLKRQEAKLSAEKMELAKARAADKLNAERVKLIDNAMPAFQKDPIGFLTKTLRLSPADARAYVQAMAVHDAAQTPQQRVAAEQQSMAQQLQQLRAEQEQWRAEQAKLANAAKIEAYIGEKIAPVLATGEYPHLMHAARITGQDIKKAIYETQWAEYQRTGKIPDAKTLADNAERRYAKEAESLRANVRPAASVGTKGAVPPKSRPGTTTEQTRAPGTRTKPVKAYVTKYVAR
jgi:hypothetical protein